ncbi:MAG: hypothetical protein H8E35_12920, partial [Ardenticatenia bacterium]|nr:hypothetical protein [Ardenticatenia bacterium]
AKVHTKDYYQIGSFAASYDSTGDDFAVGDFLATNTDGEVVIYDDSLDSVYVYDKTGATLASFAVGSGSNDPNDGDQIEIANGHVVMADAGADRILVYDGSGTQLSSFAVTFDAHDVLAVGDLTGGSAEEIVVADHSANLVRIYSEAGVNSGLTVPHTFDPFDLLAVGDVLGNAFDEVVIGDRSTGEILIYSAAGVLQGSLQLPAKVVNSATTLTTLEYYDYDLTTNQNVGGSALAIGQLYPYPSGSDSGKEEILLAPARNSDHLFPFWWNASESTLRKAQPIPWNFDEYEGLGIGELGAYLNQTQDEILVADDAGYVRLFDTSNWLSRWRTAIPIYTQDSDVILLDGHGNVDGCCGLSSYGGNVFPLDFNGHNPVVMGTSCLTGNYQDNNDKLNFPDRVLDSGAAVYIGSTANSSGYQNREAAKWLYDNWNYGESIGKVFTELERSYWTGVGTDDWWFWAYEHNLYGDPRFAAATGTTALSAGIQLADSVLDIEVPDYTVTRNNGLDWVEIPGGRLWSEPGELWLPYYAASVDVPAGQRVQTVELIDRGEPITGTGILLPMVPVTPTTGACTPEPYSGPVDDWYPPQSYDWDVLHNADGSSTLALTLFPFYYNPLTTDVQFFQHYSFEVVTETVEVDIDALETDRAQYELGGLVNIDVGVVNGGEGQDLIVSAVIRQAGAQETVAGLPLVMLDDLRGPAALSLQWDSSGVEPGNYIVEVTLQSAGSVQVLDLETQIFGLGITGGAITGFAAGPRKFEIGDQISLSLTFENTGTVAIDGAAVFEVWDEAGGTVAEFRRDISDLNPGAPITIEEVWETSAAVDETYLVMAYVSYGSTTTRPVTAQVSTNAFIYLPLTLRGG